MLKTSKLDKKHQNGQNTLIFQMVHDLKITFFNNFYKTLFDEENSQLWCYFCVITMFLQFVFVYF